MGVKTARPKPIEDMMRISIYGPTRLLNRPKLSEYLVSLAEKDYAGTKPIDPRMKTIQTKIDTYVQIDPSLPKKYTLDELATERMVMMKLALDGIDNATPSEIGEAITKYLRGRT